MSFKSQIAGRSASILSLFVVAFLLGGCSTAPHWFTDSRLEALNRSIEPEVITAASADALPRLAPSAPRSGYRVGPQDELTLTVWASKDIWAAITAQGEQATQTVVVQDDGTIVLPLLQPIRVDGLAFSQILAKVAETYRKSLCETVQVDGKITRYRAKSILIDGAFNKPGIAYLSPELRTLGEAIIATGGGLTADGTPIRGVLNRGGKRYGIDFRQAQEGDSDALDIALQAGDRIYFPSRAKGQFYIFGEVGTQGVFQIPPGGVSLIQALALARGPVPVTANMESIFLVRGSETNEPIVYQVSLKEVMENRDIPILPGDRLFMPPTALTQWDRTMRQLLPVFGSVVYVNGAL